MNVKLITQLIIYCGVWWSEKLWQGVYAIDCVVKMLFCKCTLVFLYILVFALYVQNRKKFCHCKKWLRRCNLFKPVGHWLMCRKCVVFDRDVKCCLILQFPELFYFTDVIYFFLYKHFEDMIRMVNVGFFLWHVENNT